MNINNNDSTAYLSNINDYTFFRYKDLDLKFKTAYSLEYYVKVKEWGNGYLVVDAKYKHSQELIEEYIDKAAVLEDLNIDYKKILKPIKRVEISYEPDIINVHNKC